MKSRASESGLSIMTHTFISLLNMKKKKKHWRASSDSLLLHPTNLVKYSFFFLCYNFFFLILVVFAIHWHESAMDLHVFPIPIPPPAFLPIPSLWVFPVHQPWALVSCIVGWSSVSPLIVHLFQCCSLWTSHPGLLPQSPKVFRLYFLNVCKSQYNWIQSVSGNLEEIFATYNTTYIERASTNIHKYPRIW